MNLKRLDNNIPLKAFVLRVIRIMENKGYKLDNFLSTIHNTHVGTYVNITMFKPLHSVMLSITPLDDEFYMTVSNDVSQVLIKGFVDLDKLSKLNIDNMLTNTN